MTYNSFLDFFFSSGWLIFGFIVVCLVLFGVFRKQLYVNRKRKKLITFSIYAIPILLLITYGLFNPMFFGYGKPVEITDVKLVNGKLLVTDYILTAGGKSSRGQKCFRMHVLDPATGKKELRFRVGFVNKIVGVHGDTLVLSHYEDVSFYSLTDGRELAVWSEETLPKLFPQLAAGIADFSSGDGNKIVQVSSLDGKKWGINSLTNEILPYSESNYESDNFSPTNKLFVTSHYIKRNDKPDGSDFISLEEKDGNDRLKMIYGPNDSLLNPELEFIDGDPILVSEKNNCFVVLHYVTLKKQQFILTGISLDGKRKLWELKQASLDADVPDEDADNVIVNYTYDEASGLCYLSLKKEVLAVDVKDGKVKWRTEL